MANFLFRCYSFRPMARKELGKSRPHPRRSPPTLDTRAAGILLHPTSLPGPFPSGDIGPSAYKFADDLQKAGMRWWQMLPTTPPGPPPGFGPYSSDSAFARSPWLVSPELLVRQGLLQKRDLPPAVHPTWHVDFKQDRIVRSRLLRTAFADIARLSKSDRDAFDDFIRVHSNWLPDYCLFAVLKERFNHRPWTRWPADLRNRSSPALEKAGHALAQPILFHQFVQWLFDRQWTALKRYCNQNSIGLIGDVPIFLSHDSADVWANPRLFLLDKHRKPIVVSGYPPDPFTPLGQLWGHPHYRWPVHRKNGFAWWVDRFDSMLRHFDAVRIDHFLGFYRLWTVPARAKNAVKGTWQRVPGDELLSALRKRLGNAAIIAEDLGSPIPAQLALRDKFNFPGMRILQFGFPDGPYHLPHHYPAHCVAYTGTHDNSTIVGWFRGLSKPEQKHVLAYISHPTNQLHWNFIHALFTSLARTAIIPIQDALGLDNQHRMNIPGVPLGNWDWRIKRPMPLDVIQKLKHLAAVNGRVE